MQVEVAVLGVSLALQLFAAGLALRLIRTTSTTLGWVLIAGALVLMSSRRAITLVSLLAGNEHRVSVTSEAVALLISILMVVGVALIGSTFERLKRAEQLVRDRERDVREMLNGTPDGLLLAHDGAWVYANPTATRLLGLDAHSKRDLVDVIGAEHRSALLDGPLRTNAAPGASADLVLQRDPPAAVELVAGPLVEHEGESARLFVVRDITERKRLEEGLLQSQKLEALGRMAGGIAHDINNLLTVIVSSTDLARMRAKRAMPATDELASILDASARVKALTTQLLAFSRYGTSKPELVDLDALVRDAQPLLQTLVRGAIELELVPGDGTHLTEADRSQLEQVVVNLVANARDAMPDGGRLTITTRTATLDGRTPAPWASAANGIYVVLGVSDTGTGIEPALKARIFDPFFTTKAAGKGSGMGLATCFAIARGLAGGITVDSKPGAGSTFEVWIPASTRELPPAARVVARTELPAASARTVLVVDDDAMVRNVAARTLRASGFVVKDVDSATAALELLEQDPAVAVVFSDVRMPGMSGIQLADEIEKRWPAIPVLLVSGYVEDVEPQPDLDLLAKPYRIDALVERIEASIAKKHSSKTAS